MQGLNVTATHIRGTSWLHRLNPISKLAWVLAVVFFSFASYNPFPLFAIALLGLLMGFTAGISKPLMRILLVFAPLTASVIVIQTLAPAICSNTCTTAAQLGPFTLYQQGMSHGLSLVSRVLAMEIITLGVLMTTHPSDLFAAFAKLRVPYILNFMISMTLQLIPVLQREVTVVLSAQKSRGMKSSGFGSIVPSFVPVFAGAFERVQQLSISLESRAFGSTGAKTSYRQVEFGLFDAIITVIGLLAGVIGTILGFTLWSAHKTPSLVLTPVLTIAIFLLAAILFVGTILAAIVTIARA
ncbi:MAG: energy-coupling factor transporter transmembrane protein EcfT [Chloroflexi bacterium]|nr:MAG: energy-coupling factor transporter transmembrane protein EcfT [Chloroflexota bacterium]